MSELIDRILQETHNATPSDWRRYAELVTDGVQPEERQELMALLPRLNRRPADLEPDHVVLRQVQQLQAQILAGRGKQDAADRASRAVSDHQAETQRILEARKSEQNQLETAQAHALSYLNAARTAMAALNELRQQHPQLLGHISRATEQDLI